MYMSTTLEVKWFLKKTGIMEFLDSDRIDEAVKVFHNHYFGQWMDYQEYDCDDVEKVLKDFLL